MGILDDAIREHLELKRRHGVPEDEVQRQEDEALGPARREVAQQPEEAEMSAGQTATAEAERDEPPAVDQGAGLFDMEVPHAEPGPEPEPERPAAEPEHPTVVAEPPAVAEEPVVAEAPVADEPPAAMEPSPTADSPPVAEPEPPPVEEPAPPESAAQDDALGDTEPHGFAAIEDEEEESPAEEELLESDPEAEDLDVLEDTPDFLQETPEHDRLWFEQKPPRDFDFD